MQSPVGCSRGGAQLTEMPLGQRAGDKSDSRFSGVEVLDFPAGECLPAVLNQSLSSGFDFLLSPLVSNLLLRYHPPPFSSFPLTVTCSPRFRLTLLTGPRREPCFPYRRQTLSSARPSGAATSLGSSASGLIWIRRMSSFGWTRSSR